MKFFFFGIFFVVILAILALAAMVFNYSAFQAKLLGKGRDATFSDATPNPSQTPEPLKFKVSIPYWDQEKAANSFRENVNKVGYISLFWYFMDEEGDINKYRYAKEDTALIDFAHKNNVLVEVVITNLPEKGGWDTRRVEKVIRDDGLRRGHIEAIVAITERLGIDGVDIDYEQLDPTLKDDFSKFMRELGLALDARGKYLGVALHPKSNDGIGRENGSLAQDWVELSRAVDNMYIMAFGEHWDEGEAGPVASLPWVERVINYAQELGIDKRKLFLTIPLYGYSWKSESDETAKGLTYTDVRALLAKYGVNEEWDEGALSPHFHYEDGEEYEVWYENGRSVEEKIRLAQKAGFGGVSFWRLGGEDNAIWKAILEINP